MFKPSSLGLSPFTHACSKQPLLHRTARIRPAEAREARSLRSSTSSTRTTPSTFPDHPPSQATQAPARDHPCETRSAVAGPVRSLVPSNPPSPSHPDPLQASASLLARRKHSDQLEDSSLRHARQAPRTLRPRSRPTASEKEELKDFLSHKAGETRRGSMDSDHRKRHHRWAWEWFSEGHDLSDIGRQLSRLATDSRVQCQPLSPIIVSSWILKHLSRPLHIDEAGPSHRSLGSACNPLEHLHGQDPDDQPVCPPSPAGAHSFHLLTPALWSRLTDPHQPQFKGKSFAETLGKLLEDREKENESVWNELSARGWRGEGLVTREGHVLGYGADTKKLRTTFAEGGEIGGEDLNLDSEVLSRILTAENERIGTRRNEPETARIKKLLLAKQMQEMAQFRSRREHQKGRDEASTSTGETWEDVTVSYKRKMR